jgi:hypothetical protein
MAYEDYGDEIHPAPQSEEKLKTEKDKDQLIKDIQFVLSGGRGDKDNENELINIVQKHRTLVLDIATQTYISKPNNPKLLDSINTILAQLEKAVRDDRKERLKDKELEDNRANFATFANALNEITAGRIVVPNYGTQAIILDPMAPMINLSVNPDDEIKGEELYQGHQIVDSKEIEASFAELEDIRVTGTTEDKDDSEDTPWDPES